MARKEAAEREKGRSPLPSLSLFPNAAAKACRTPAGKEPGAAEEEAGASTPSSGTEGWDAEGEGRGKQLSRRPPPQMARTEVSLLAEEPKMNREELLIFLGLFAKHLLCSGLQTRLQCEARCMAPACHGEEGMNPETQPRNYCDGCTKGEQS